MLTDELGREISVGDFVIVKESFGIVYHMTEEYPGHHCYRVLTADGHYHTGDEKVYFRFSKSTGNRYSPWRKLIQIPTDIIPDSLHHVVWGYKERIMRGDVPSIAGRERFYA